MSAAVDIREFKLFPYSDEWLQLRLNAIEHVEAGNVTIATMPGPIVQAFFPNGYDPVHHPEDDSVALSNELGRRGVLVS